MIDNPPDNKICKGKFNITSTARPRLIADIYSNRNTLSGNSCVLKCQIEKFDTESKPILRTVLKYKEVLKAEIC